MAGDDQRHDLVQELAVGHRLAGLPVARVEQQRHDVVAAHAVAAPARDVLHDELAQLPELVGEGKVARGVVGEERERVAAVREPSRARSSPNSASRTTSSVASLMSCVTLTGLAARGRRCQSSASRSVAAWMCGIHVAMTLRWKDGCDHLALACASGRLRSS